MSASVFGGGNGLATEPNQSAEVFISRAGCGEQQKFSKQPAQIKGKTMYFRCQDISDIEAEYKTEPEGVEETEEDYEDN